MTNHDAMFAQAREVLMQHQAVEASYTGPDRLITQCSGIADQYESRRVPGDHGGMVVEERLKFEVPNAKAAGGLDSVETAGSFSIDGYGDGWGIESLPPGAPGFFRVQLVRRQQTTAGRRR